MEINACLVCGGRKETRCNFCNGSGNVGATSDGPAVARTTKRAHHDPLEGTWHAAQGGRYEVIKNGNAYRVDEYGAMGKVGGGTATLSGGSVTFDVTNALLGRYVIQFGLQGNQMRGTMNVMGMPMPIVLSRN